MLANKLKQFISFYPRINSRYLTSTTHFGFQTVNQDEKESKGNSKTLHKNYEINFLYILGYLNVQCY